MRYWHDLVPGQKFATNSITLSKQEIIDFALEFDPQPYHLNSDAAENSIFGGLCASGWQTCALMMQLLTEAFKLNDITLMGVRDAPSLHWKRPVFVNDQLAASVVIASCQSDSGRLGLGCINCDINLHNQKQQAVLVLNVTLLVAHAEGKDADTQAPP